MPKIVVLPADTPIEISGSDYNEAMAGSVHIRVGENGPVLRLIDQYPIQGLSYVAATVVQGGAIAQPDRDQLPEVKVPHRVREVEENLQLLFQRLGPRDFEGGRSGFTLTLVA